MTIPEAVSAMVHPHHLQQLNKEDDFGEICSHSTASLSISPDNPYYVTTTTKTKNSNPNAGLEPSKKPSPITTHDTHGNSSLSDSNSSNGSVVDDGDVADHGDHTHMKLSSITTMDDHEDYSHMEDLEPETFPKDVLPESFHMSPEPIPNQENLTQEQQILLSDGHHGHHHHFHSLQQIKEDQISDDDMSIHKAHDEMQQQQPLGLRRQKQRKEEKSSKEFVPIFSSTKLFHVISQKVFNDHDEFAAATWIGFWALLNVTCANYVITPMRDAVALQVGVQHIPKLTMASSILAFVSSVPIGWLFEAPDPNRRKLWKKMGLTRGETQGTSLALFYRFFAFTLLSYAVGFKGVEWLQTSPSFEKFFAFSQSSTASPIWQWISILWNQLGRVMYIAFFLVVHLMKLHSLSLVWGVTTEAMEYEDVARKGQGSKTRLQRLGLVGFGGTLGGILGSVLASSLAKILHLSGLLVLSALLLEVAAELSIELGRIMQKHWEEQQIFKSHQDLASLDTSMQRSVSLGSMKRVASGNTLNLNKMAQSTSTKSLNDMDNLKDDSSQDSNLTSNSKSTAATTVTASSEELDDNTFTQRLLRGIKTILRSRLLMAIFTYNALFSSTTVLLSFQRAALVANRKASTTVSADTAFLANINMASSVAVFALQASGLGAFIAQKCGSRGALSLMPLIRLVGVISLAWWHKISGGQPPNLIVFLMLDECTRVMNLAVAKPVRESLWRGLSNEARYEAKPIVDTLANRWGAGSASFCVSIINKTLLWAGVAAGVDGIPVVWGFPPMLFLLLIVAAWWAMVSADLGQIRRRIDLELKKHQ